MTDGESRRHFAACLRRVLPVGPCLRFNALSKAESSHVRDRQGRPGHRSPASRGRRVSAAVGGCGHPARGSRGDASSHPDYERSIEHCVRCRHAWFAHRLAPARSGRPPGKFLEEGIGHQVPILDPVSGLAPRNGRVQPSRLVIARPSFGDYAGIRLVLLVMGDPFRLWRPRRAICARAGLFSWPGQGRAIMATATQSDTDGEAKPGPPTHSPHRTRRSGSTAIRTSSTGGPSGPSASCSPS